MALDIPSIGSVLRVVASRWHVRKVPGLPHWPEEESVFESSQDMVRRFESQLRQEAFCFSNDRTPETATALLQDGECLSVSTGAMEKY